MIKIKEDKHALEIWNKYQPISLPKLNMLCKWQKLSVYCLIFIGKCSRFCRIFVEILDEPPNIFCIWLDILFKQKCSLIFRLWYSKTSMDICKYRSTKRVFGESAYLVSPDTVVLLQQTVLISTKPSCKFCGYCHWILLQHWHHQTVAPSLPLYYVNLPSSCCTIDTTRLLHPPTLLCEPPPQLLNLKSLYSNVAPYTILDHRCGDA